MAEGRQMDGWGHTSSVLALMANLNRDPKKTKPFTPDDFNPTRAKSKPKRAKHKADISILKAAFIDKDMTKVAQMMEGSRS